MNLFDRMQFCPRLQDSGWGKATSVPQLGVLVFDVSLIQGIAVVPPFFVHPEDHFISLRFKFLLIGFPVEGVHFLQSCDAVLGDQHGPFFVDLLGLHPSPALVNHVCRLSCPLADEMRVDDIPVHVNPVGVDVKVQDPALAVAVQRGDVLGVPEVRGFCAFALGLFRKVDGVECSDEVIRQFPPVIQGPADAFFPGRGDFDPDGGELQGPVLVQLPTELLLKGHHPRPNGGGRDSLREMVKLDDVDQFFLGRVIDGGTAVRNHLCFCNHGLLFSFVENVLQFCGKFGEKLNPRAHEAGAFKEGLPLLCLDAVEHVEELDDVPAGIADLVIRFYLLLGQVVLWLVAECTLPGVFADGHATFFGPLFHLVILFLRDPGVQVQGAPGQIFQPFLLFPHNLLPFKSMRACERSGAIVGQAASRIVRHWHI